MNRFHGTLAWTLMLISCSNAAIGMEILPLSEGFTLAQFGDREAPHTLLVHADEGDALHGHDLSAILGKFPLNPLDLVAEIDQKYYAAEGGSAWTRVGYAELLPMGWWSDANVAAGVNYDEHKQESKVRGRVFLFPKLTGATPAIAEVGSLAGDMLDYEVELAVTFDRDIAHVEELAGARMGFFICNDFTERATLARQADRDNVQSGRGFADAKGFPGSFQTGPYMVVPHDWEAFFAKVKIALTVNGVVRQSDSVTEMETPIPGLVGMALAHGSAAKWTHGGKAVPMLPSGIFTKGTTLLTGTPAGVIFAPPGKAFIAKSAAWSVLTLNAFRGGVTSYVTEQFIAEEIASKKYLQPGDEVVVSGTYLGRAVATIKRVESR